MFSTGGSCGRQDHQFLWMQTEAFLELDSDIFKMPAAYMSETFEAGSKIGYRQICEGLSI